MSQAPSITARRPWLRWAALAAVVLVPLAFAGLFIGAVSQLNHGISSIPAAIVNNDQLVEQTAADGTKSPVLAGRELVTELTGAKSAGFSWTITNSKDAKAQLASGKVYAILTVPKDFSKSIVSLSSKSPVRAKLSIATDDSHNYLTGSVAQIVGDSLSSAFGQAITKQYIAGIYSGIGGVGSSLQSAADGATKLSGGATSLASGLHSLAAGTSKSASGASSLAYGTSKYVSGVSTVAQSTKKIASGVAGYTGGVSKLSSGVDQIIAQLPADDPDLPVFQGIASQLHAVAGAGKPLASGASQLASGTSTLASSGTQLVSGTRSLASGLTQLASGSSKSATGASSLATGATKLASGLSSGAASAPSYTKAQIAQTADVASSPVGVSVHREHKVSSPGQIIATLFVPLGLWIGSLAVFLVMRPLTRRLLSSTAGNRRLVTSAIGRASIVTGAQALLLVLLLHTAVGVSWTLLPATILFSLVMALAFTAFHYLLTIGLGRAGLVVSIFLLAIQITSTGGLYPIQLLATPFQIVSPLLPLTYGVQGMQAIISNSGAGSAIGAALALVAFGVGSLLVALLAVRRTRRARALGLVPALA
ncbi:MAG TPA: YhgE/Pip family protein [Galbitalea sp.]|jgi:putative membrane protein